jgi:DNA (cytosine-5)-methyltransferase 1
VAYCEIDPHARQVIEDNVRRRRLDAAPIFSDVREVSAAELRRAHVESVDLISAGFPCIDLSPAGLRRGLLRGEHSVLVTEVLRLARQLRPSYLFFENVPNIVRDADYPELLRRLSRLGYDCFWTFVSASDVGARHLRNRWFLLARRRRAPVPLEPRDTGSLRRLLQRSAPLVAPRSHRFAALQSRFMGNAVVPACALRALVSLSVDKPGPLVSLAAPWRPGRPAAFVAGRLRQRSVDEETTSAVACSASSYLVTPPKPSARAAPRLPLLTEPFRKACAPTPRATPISMLPCRSMTQRTAKNTANFLFSSEEFRREVERRRGRGESHEEARARLMVHPHHLAVFMGFPPDWTDDHLERETRAYCSRFDRRKSTIASLTCDHLR